MIKFCGVQLFNCDEYMQGRGQSYKFGGHKWKFLATTSTSLKSCCYPFFTSFLIGCKEIPSTILAKVGCSCSHSPRGQATEQFNCLVDSISVGGGRQGAGGGRQGAAALPHAGQKSVSLGEIFWKNNRNFWQLLFLLSSSIWYFEQKIYSPPKFDVFLRPLWIASIDNIL